MSASSLPSASLPERLAKSAIPADQGTLGAAAGTQSTRLSVQELMRVNHGKRMQPPCRRMGSRQPGAGSILTRRRESVRRLQGGGVESVFLHQPAERAPVFAGLDRRPRDVAAMLAQHLLHVETLEGRHGSCPPGSKRRG